MADIKTILTNRYELYKSQQIQLIPIVFFGKIISNEFASTSLLELLEPIHIEIPLNIPAVMRYDDFKDFIKSNVKFQSFRQVFINHDKLPTENEFCVHCGKRFEIRRLDTVQYLNDGWLSHLECHIEDLDAKHRYKFNEALNQAGFKVYGLTRTENNYGSLEYRGHWFIADTNLGNITIGYRKRVIDVKFDKPIEIIDGKDTTTYKGGFHAYDQNELISRLTLLKTTLTK